VVRNPIAGGFGAGVTVVVLILGSPLFGAPRQPDSVAGLIADLGSAEFPVREAATRKLTEMPRVAPWVRRARMNPDPEVANRARLLNTNYARARGRNISDVVKRPPGDLPIDLFIECYLAWQPDAVEELWQPGFDAAHRAVGCYAKLLPANVKSSLGETIANGLPQLKEWNVGDPVRQFDGDDGVYDQRSQWLVRTNRLVPAPRRIRLGIARGAVGPSHLVSGVIFTLGKVNRETTVADRSVVLAEQGSDPVPAPDSPSPLRYVSNSFVVARGSIACGYGGIKSSVVLAGGDVNIGSTLSLKDSTIIAGGKVIVDRKRPVENCIIKENVKNPTAPFTFFEVADVGLTLGTPAKDAKGLPVGDIKPDTPFGKAGVRKGDTILAIDDAPPGDAEAFRVKLRRAIVVQGDTLLTVSRDGKTLDLPVYFPLPKPPEK
jgi:hypothetical protein